MKVKGWRRKTKKTNKRCDVVCMQAETEQLDDGDIDARLVICSTSLSRVQMFRDRSSFDISMVSSFDKRLSRARVYHVRIATGQFAVVINCYFRPQ